MKNKNIGIDVFIMMAILILPLQANALSTPTMASIDTMFANFQTSAIAITKLVQYSSYIIGLFLVIGSIFKFSQLGSNPQLSPKVPFTMFFVGIFVFALTGSISVVSQTLAMGAGPGDTLMASVSGTNAITQAGATGVMYFIRLVGYIAFIRGWLLLNQAGQGKEGVIGRGLTHIAGGVASINIDITSSILGNTFGWHI